MPHSRYQWHDAIVLAHRADPFRWALLDREEKRALYLSYFAFDVRYRTQAECAKRLGVSVARMRRAIFAAMHKLDGWRFLGGPRVYARPDDPPMHWGVVREELRGEPGDDPFLWELDWERYWRTSRRRRRPRDAQD